MGDQIIIKGLELACHIGVPAQERAEVQKLRAHLTMTVSSFPRKDDIQGTVDYKKVADQVRELAATRERKLIETLAQEIASHVLTSFPVKEIRVEIEKQILPETDWVGVIIHRSI